jgi:hypothetical protein
MWQPGPYPSEKPNTDTRVVTAEIINARVLNATDINSPALSVPIWEYDHPDDRNHVRLLTDDHKRSDIVFGAAGLESTDAGADTRRLMYDVTNGAIRAGEASGTQWDLANRGANSVAFGLDNTASAPRSAILCGEGHAIDSSSFNASILAGGEGPGAQHVIVGSVDALIGAGSGHRVSSANSAFVLCGIRNTVNGGTSSGIVGGEDNELLGPLPSTTSGKSVILCGQRNAIGQSASSFFDVNFSGNAERCAIVAGNQNAVSGDLGNGRQVFNSVILCGQRNGIGVLTTAWPAPVGASGSVENSCIAAGENNSIVLVGGAVVRSFIGCGTENVVSGDNSAVLSGFRNVCTAARSAILAGSNQDLDDDDTAQTQNLVVTGALRTTMIRLVGVSDNVDESDFIVIATAAPITLTLPSATVSNPGRTYIIKKRTGAGNVTIAANGVETIASSTGTANTYTLSTATPGDIYGITLVNSGAGTWDIIDQMTSQ